MIHEMEEIPGVKYVLGTDAVLGPRIRGICCRIN